MTNIGSKANSPIGVVCVDDNLFVAEAIKIRLTMSAPPAPPEFHWRGHLPSADELISFVESAVQRGENVDIVLLDIDMPGRDSLEALVELSLKFPSVRTIIVSGYEREDYLDRAVEAGAWGYVSKNDGPEQIINAIREVHAGRFAFGVAMGKGSGIRNQQPVLIAHP